MCPQILLSTYMNAQGQGGEVYISGPLNPIPSTYITIRKKPPAISKVEPVMPQLKRTPTATTRQ